MGETRWFMKEPCEHCPFRRDVTPFLHPERAAEIANAACNPYSSFHCHKTLGYDEDEDETISVSTSLMCAGFLTMQLAENGEDPPEGFTLSDEVYADPYEMEDAYLEEWERRGR